MKWWWRTHRQETELHREQIEQLHLRLAETEETIERLQATINAVVVRIDRMQDKRP